MSGGAGAEDRWPRPQASHLPARIYCFEWTQLTLSKSRRFYMRDGRTYARCRFHGITVSLKKTWLRIFNRFFFLNSLLFLGCSSSLVYRPSSSTWVSFNLIFRFLSLWRSLSFGRCMLSLSHLIRNKTRTTWNKQSLASNGNDLTPICILIFRNL